MSNNQLLGQQGEEIAARYLTQHGFVILDRNWRCDRGEIDIVASDGDFTVFVEVKTRRSLGYGHPFEAITAKKINRMRELALRWCLSHSHRIFQIRNDAVSVLLRGNTPARIEHLRGVS